MPGLGTPASERQGAPVRFARVRFAASRFASPPGRACGSGAPITTTATYTPGALSALASPRRALSVAIARGSVRGRTRPGLPALRGGPGANRGRCAQARRCRRCERRACRSRVARSPWYSGQSPALFGEFDCAAQQRCPSCGEGSVRGQNSDVIYPGRVLRFLPPEVEKAWSGARSAHSVAAYMAADDVPPRPQGAERPESRPPSGCCEARPGLPIECVGVVFDASRLSGGRAGDCVPGLCIFRRGRPSRADPALDILPPAGSSRARRNGGHRSQGAGRQSRPRAHTRLRRTDRRCP